MFVCLFVHSFMSNIKYHVCMHAIGMSCNLMWFIQRSWLKDLYSVDRGYH